MTKKLTEEEIKNMITDYRNLPPFHPRKLEILSRENINLMSELYSMNQIGKLFKISMDTLYRRIDPLNQKPRDHRLIKRDNYYRDNFDNIMNLVNQGYDNIELQKKLNISNRKLIGFLIEFNLPRSYKARRDCYPLKASKVILPDSYDKPINQN